MFVVCGLNQQTPIHYREQIAVNPSSLDALLCELLLLPGVDECVILSTCHRTEFYANVENPLVLQNWWQQKHQNIWSHIEPFFYCFEHETAKAHCLRVACGIDSVLVGEPQIFGQLKQAYQLASQLDATGQYLKTWFEFVFESAKKIRHESGISLHPISVASVAVDSIEKHFKETLVEQKALIVGSGDTARLAALHLKEKGVSQFFVTSRQLEHANRLAQELNGKAIGVADLTHHMHWADIIVTATSCPYPFITQNVILDTLSQRQQQPMFLVDLAVPRDIEPLVGQIPAITLIDIDSLQRIQAQNTAERTKAAGIALEMTETALEEFAKRKRVRQAQDMICSFRNQMQELTELELQRAEKKLIAGECSRRVLKQLSERLLQKLIHQPTIGLQDAAMNNRPELLELAHYLFNNERIKS